MPEEIKKPQGGNDIEDNKVIAAISYIGILCLVPLLAKKESAFAQFHGKQGLVLFIVWVVVGIVAMIPFIGWVIAPLASIALLVVSLIGLVQTLGGKYWKLPYLAEYAEKIKL